LIFFLNFIGKIVNKGALQDFQAVDKELESINMMGRNCHKDYPLITQNIFRKITEHFCVLPEYIKRLRTHFFDMLAYPGLFGLIDEEYFLLNPGKVRNFRPVMRRIRPEQIEDFKREYAEIVSDKKKYYQRYPEGVYNYPGPSTHLGLKKLKIYVKDI
jgi:hypothetical protein